VSAERRPGLSDHLLKTIPFYSHTDFIGFLKILFHSLLSFKTYFLPETSWFWWHFQFKTGNRI
jgi:hypothetical protein